MADLYAHICEYCRSEFRSAYPFDAFCPGPEEPEEGGVKSCRQRRDEAWRQPFAISLPPTLARSREPAETRPAVSPARVEALLRRGGTKVRPGVGEEFLTNRMQSQRQAMSVKDAWAELC